MVLMMMRMMMGERLVPGEEKDHDLGFSDLVFLQFL